jgi:hypothetical protein
VTWPYPGDSPAARARRVALAYRQRLLKVAPAVCADLDATMRDFGQHWAIPRPVVADPEAWVSARDAAELAAIGLSTLRKLRERGRLTGRRISPRRWEYQVKEVMSLTTQPRPRTTKEKR